MNFNQFNEKVLKEVNKLYNNSIKINQDQLILMDFHRTDNKYQALYKIDKKNYLLQAEYIFATNRFNLKVYVKNIEKTSIIKEEKQKNDTIKTSKKPTSTTEEEVIDQIIATLLRG